MALPCTLLSFLTYFFSVLQYPFSTSSLFPARERSGFRDARLREPACALDTWVHPSLSSRREKSLSLVRRDKKSEAASKQTLKRQSGHCVFVGELLRVATRPPPINPVGTRCEPRTRLLVGAFPLVIFSRYR